MFMHWLMSERCMFFGAFVKAAICLPYIGFSAAWTLDMVNYAILLRIWDMVFYSTEF